MTGTIATDDLERLEVLREALRGARILSRATHPGGLVAVNLLLSAQAFTGLAWAVSDPPSPDDPSPEGLWPAGRSPGFAQAGSTETLQRDPLQRERRR
ncbi:MAG: hypothetical protein ACE5FR_10770 [Rhodospirillales bacterium]